VAVRICEPQCITSKSPPNLSFICVPNIIFSHAAHNFEILNSLAPNVMYFTSCMSHSKMKHLCFLQMFDAESAMMLYWHGFSDIDTLGID